MLVLALVAVGLLVVPASYGTSLVQSAPHVSTSIYVTTTNTTTAYNEGCAQGTADASHPSEDSEVILDFGGQNSSDTGTIFTINNGSGGTYAQDAAYAEQFASGYWVCTGSDTTSVLYLALGTNNSAYQVSSAGGAKWANSVVGPASDWINGNGIASQVTMEGANDMEPTYHGPADTIAWTDGFTNAAVGTYLDYGSSDGCSTTSYNNASCNNGWTQANEYYVAWGNTNGFAMPEIYYDPSCPVSGSQAVQWTLISRYGHYNGVFDKIFFDGPLTQHTSSSSSGCTPDQAWNAFWKDLNTNTSLPLGPDGLSSTSSDFIYRSNI